MKLSKLLVYLVIALFVVAGSYFFISSKNSESPSVNNSESEWEIIDVVLPTPTPQPSEKALKIASFAWARITANQKKEISHIYEDEASSSSEIIHQWALRMDGDSALMAQNEAKMQRIMKQEDRPIYYEPDSVGDTNEALCQKAMVKYQECMNRYTEEVGDYAECIENKTRYGYTSFCSSPSNVCVKPMCKN